MVSEKAFLCLYSHLLLYFKFLYENYSENLAFKICCTISADPIASVIGKNISTEKRDNSSINTQDVMGIFCAKPRKITAPKKAANPSDTGLTIIDHNAAKASDNVLPSIIDGVIRPP